MNKPDKYYKGRMSKYWIVSSPLEPSKFDDGIHEVGIYGVGDGLSGFVSRAVVSKSRDRLRYEVVRVCPDPSLTSSWRFTRRGAIRKARQLILEVVADMRSQGLNVEEDERRSEER